MLKNDAKNLALYSMFVNSPFQPQISPFFEIFSVFLFHQLALSRCLLLLVFQDLLLFILSKQKERNNISRLDKPTIRIRSVSLRGKLRRARHGQRSVAMDNWTGASVEWRDFGKAANPSEKWKRATPSGWLASQFQRKKVDGRVWQCSAEASKQARVPTSSSLSLVPDNSSGRPR